MVEPISKQYNTEIRKLDNDEGVYCITVRGFLDTESVGDFQAKVDTFLEETTDPLLVADFSDLIYVSSSGLGAVMKLYNTVKQTGGSMVVLRPPESIMKIFEMLNLTSVLTFADDVPDALQILDMTS
jgi:anti-sigma B factor antagonist